MSVTSKLTTLGAAGSGGVVPAEFGSEVSSTQGLHAHTANCVEIPNTNFIAVLAVHQTRDVYLHIVQVNGSNLTAVLRDTEHLDNNYNSDYGCGIAWNPQNSKLVCLKLDTSGNFKGYQIEVNTANGQITSNQSASLGNWSSGYRKPHRSQNILMHWKNEYFIQNTVRSNGERQVRTIQNYNNNNWSTYNWVGVGVTGDQNTAHRIIRNDTDTADHPTYDMGVYNNDTYLLGRYANLVSTNSYDNSDMVSAQPILTGSDIGLASGWDNKRDKLHIYKTDGTGSDYADYRTYDNDTSRTSSLSQNPSSSGTDNTTSISGGLANASFTEGASGNVIGFGDKEFNSSALNVYQFVYNDTGHVEVANILSASSRRHMKGTPGAYNTAQDCSLIVYRANTDNYNWYFRAMRGIIA